MSSVAPRRRADVREQPGRSRALVVLAAVAAVLTLGMAADIFAAPAPPAPTPAVEQGPAVAGSWFCPAVAAENEQVALTVAAVGDQPSEFIVDRYSKGRAVPDELRTVEPGGSAVVVLEGQDAQAPAVVRWTGGPAVVSWRVDGTRTAAAPCEPAPAERWYIPGFNSVRGSRPTLHLFNPFTADAAVRLVFATPEGSHPLALTENIPVAAGGTTSINLRRYMPEEPDLGVTVEVLAGRVVAQGQQTIDPPGNASGAAGRFLLGGASEPSESWAFAYAADTEGTESWLSVLNPGDDVAAVQFRVSTPSEESGTFVGEVSVPPGGLSRIELAGVSREAEFGVTLVSVNSEPVIVSRFTALRSSRGVLVMGGLGAPELSRRLALVGGGGDKRSGLISLYNPGPDEARVDLLAEGAPPEWSGVILGPNDRAVADLSAAGPQRPSIPVLVSSDVPIVAALRSRATEGSALRMWLASGVAESTWLGPPTRPPVRRDPSLATHAGQAPTTEAPLLLDLDEAPTPAATQAP